MSSLYQYGKDTEEVERMNYLEFIARATSHIPEKGQVTIPYLGLYANAHSGKVRRSKGNEQKLILIEEECPRISRREEKSGRFQALLSLSAVSYPA